MFVSFAVELFKRFAHHHEFRLAISLEHARVSLAEHLGDEVVCHSTGAEPRRENVPKVIYGKVRNAGSP